MSYLTEGSWHRVKIALPPSLSFSLESRTHKPRSTTVTLHSLQVPPHSQLLSKSSVGEQHHRHTGQALTMD